MRRLCFGGGAEDAAADETPGPGDTVCVVGSLVASLGEEDTERTLAGVELVTCFDVPFESYSVMRETRLALGPFLRKGQHLTEKQKK